MPNVPMTNVNAYYSNTSPGNTILSNVIDAAIQDIVQAINDNWAIYDAFVTNMTLPIPDQSIVERHIRNLAITNPKLAPSAVTNDKIADGTITAAKLADLLITTSKLADLSVTNGKLVALSVTGDKIANSTITTDKLQDLLITTAKLGDGSVTESKLSNSSVSTRVLADRSVTAGKLDPSIINPISDAGIQYQFGLVNEQLENIAIQVDLFGAVGDGVTSDSIAFQNAISKALTNSLPAIQLRQGRTYLLKASDIANYSGVSIFGNGATLKFDGNVRFNLQNLTQFTATDLIIETNVGLTEDTASQLGFSTFYYTDNTKSVLYNIRNVRMKSTASQTPKVARHGTLFSLAKTLSGSSFANISTENVGMTLLIHDGQDTSISHIYGTNSETLVYIQNGNGFGIFDLSIKNTEVQSLTWICKNNGTLTNGKDVLLIESGANNVNIDQIYGEFCIERGIYCQAGNVIANNLTVKECYGFKFCGTNYANRKSNITIKNVTKIITDASTFDAAKTYAILDLYYLTNVSVENVELKNYRSDKLTSLGTYCITLLDGLINLSINKVKVEINTSIGLFYSTVLNDNTKTLSNIKILNVEMTNYGDTTGGSYFLTFGGTAPVGWINGIQFDNLKVLQDTAQIIASDTSRFFIDVFSKKAIGIVATNIDTGYLKNGNPLFQNDSAFVSDNITQLEFTHRFKSSGAAANGNYDGSYYSGYATGASTGYVGKCKCIQELYTYYAHSDFQNKIVTEYENITVAAVRKFDCIKSIMLDMILDIPTSWNLPLNVIGKSYMVEVESSLGAGRAVFNGNAITEIYKTGNCVFDGTASKLQIQAIAGSGSDFYIQVNNLTGTAARVKVKVTKM